MDIIHLLQQLEDKDKVQLNVIKLVQPDLIRNYNKYMGGMDLYDNQYQTTAPQYAQRNGAGHCGYQF